MERQLVEISDGFQSRRKPLLKSETLFSLLRVLSFCDSQLPPPEVRPGSNSSDEPKRQACVQVGGSDVDCLAQKMDEGEDELMHNCSVVDKIMELDHAIKGNADFGVDCNESPGVTSGEGTCLDSHPLGESRIVSEQTIQEEGSGPDVSKLLDSKVLRASQESGSKLKEIITSEKPSVAMVYPNGMIVGDEAEEGEIYVDSRIGEGADLKSCKDSTKLKGIKLDEKQLSSRVIDGAGCSKQSASNATDGNQFPSYSRTKTNKVTSSSIEGVTNGLGNKDKIDIPVVSNRKTVVYDDLLFTGGPEVWKEGKKGERAKGQRIIHETVGRNNGARGGEVGKVKRHAEQNKHSAVKVDVRYADMSAEKSSQDRSGSQVSACRDKDGSLCKNKKRGPLTDARKEARKRTKRKKRAETNKELGVKRLKLQPVVNQKPVAVCRHYMMGRCQEYEKCKFSHDAIPSTKSKPCIHFARDQCIKMDKCPFDHQLSKYPCEKYKSTGSCIRGEKCLFSHKDLPNEEVSTLGSVKPKSSVLTGNVGTKRKLDIVDNLHQNGKTLSVPAAVSSAKIQQVGRKNVLNALVVAPTGIAGKPLLGGSNCTLPGFSSMAAGDAPNTNHTAHHSSGVADNSNTPLKGTPPAVTPKGINFLSFGKSSLLLSAAKQSSVKPISFDDSLKPPLSKTSSPYKQVSDARNIMQMGGVKLARECKVIPKTNEVGGVKLLSEFNVTPKANGMAHKTVHLTASPKHDSLLGRKASADDCNRHIHAHLPSSSHGGISITGEGSKTAYDKNHSLRATLLGLPSSSFGSGQSSGHGELLQLKNVPNSVRNSLMSTLAFAAKVDSDMKKKISGI
ncbi:Zinc finger CCCH domain-containing protein 65 [Linum grandiflorum]